VTANNVTSCDPASNGKRGEPVPDGSSSAQTSSSVDHQHLPGDRSAEHQPDDLDHDAHPDHDLDHDATPTT